MRPVFDYLDYRDILRDAYEDRKGAMPLYSYRLMGDKLGVDGSYLFRILHKDLHLPVRCHPRAIEFLGLNGRTAEYFLLLAAYQRERGARARKEILDKAFALRDVARARIEGDELAFFRNWWNVAVRSLLEVMEGRAVPHELASRLRPEISEDQVRESLTLLLKLGLVRRESSERLLPAQTHLTASAEVRNEAVCAFQRTILALASESIERFPPGTRDLSTLTVAVDAQAVQEVREMLRECRRQIQKRVEEVARPDRVMQMAMVFFPLAPAEETA